MEVLDGKPSLKNMLDDLINALMQIDECFTRNDVNSAVKKTHEAITVVKSWQEALKE